MTTTRYGWEVNELLMRRILKKLLRPARVHARARTRAVPEIRPTRSVLSLRKMKVPLPLAMDARP